MNTIEEKRIFESELATFWFDNEGILHAEAKLIPRTLENQKQTYEYIRKISDNKKVCMLSNATRSKPMDKETRDYIAKEMPNVIKAMAVISQTSLGFYISNIFLSLKRQPVPIKLFTTETEAKEWLRKYL
jgi:beta-glucosidase/6-phospho-beta-glucosidase/beta-galactosidase